MTFTGKILVCLNLILSLLFMAFAAAVYTTRVDLRGEINKLNSAVAKANQDVNNANTEKAAVEKELENERNKLKQVEAENARQVASLREQVQQLRGNMNSSQQESTGYAAELRNATRELQQRRDEVENLRKLHDKVLKDNTELVREKTRLSDELTQTKSNFAQLLERNNQLVDRIRRLEGWAVKVRGARPTEDELVDAENVTPPPDAEGVVVKIEGNLVEISIGEDDGVRKNQVFEVYRMKPRPEYIGQIRIVSTEATTAVGRTLNLTRQIQVDDRVGPRILQASRVN